jgi:flavin-dependent dehydrogenase
VPNVDVLVAGGGPVGLAVAIEARLAGLSVVIVEPRAAPIDKACGEGLMPGAVAALARLGVRPEGHPLTGISYIGNGRRADHDFRGADGLGVRRIELHRALTARALELGVDVLQAKVEDVSHDAHGVIAAGVRASWLMACDGLHSPIRRSVGLERPARGTRPRRYGLRRHYRCEPWSTAVEVHRARRAEAYVTPVGEGVVGIAVLGPAKSDFDEVLADLPELATSLSGATVLGPTLGAGPMLQETKARTQGRIRLVGDAAGYVDALTGEGIRVGLAQASVAIATLDDDVTASAARYEKAWRATTHDYRLLTRGLVSAARSPLRRSIVPTSAALPSVYGAIVERLAR